MWNNLTKGIGFLLTWGFIIININSVQLKVTVAMVTACWVNSMLVTNDFPELKQDGFKSRNKSLDLKRFWTLNKNIKMELHYKMPIEGIKKK